MKDIINVIENRPKKPESSTPCGAICGNGDLGIVFDDENDDILIHISKCDFWKFAVGTQGDGGIKTIGKIRIGNAGPDKYKIVQFLNKGSMECTFGNAQIKLFVAPNNCIYLSLSAADSGNFPAFNIEIADTSESSNFEYSDKGTHWYLRKFDGKDVVRESAVAVCCRRLDTKRTDGIKTVDYCISVATNFDSKDYISRSIQLAVDADILRDRKSTEQYWKNYFSASGITLADKKIQNAYYGSLYLLGCCMGNKEFPPGLFGNFITNDNVPWKGDYHLNYNFEAPFYCLFSSNHTENAECYIQPLLDMVEKGKDFAKLESCKGIYFPVNFGPKGLDLYSQKTCKEHGILFLGQKSNAAYAAVIPVMYWYSTFDKEYAREKLYPYLKQVGLFWEDYLIKENGRYVIKNDAVHEIPYYRGKKFNYFTHKSQIEAKNNILSLGLVRMLFKCITDMATELNSDTDKIPLWQDILNNLSKFPTFIKHGKRCFRYTEKGPRWRSDNSVGIQHIYPASQIGLSSDKKTLKIARNTYFINDRRLDDNGSVSYLPCGARLGVKPEFLLEGIRKNIDKFRLSNMLFDHIGGCVEHLTTIPATINEMLMQSHEGIIRLFPCWDKKSDAAFENLRADGAFLVSSEIKSGKVASLKIKSLAGRKCRVEVPGNVKISVRQDNGKKIRFIKTDNYVEFKTQADVTYTLL